MCISFNVDIIYKDIMFTIVPQPNNVIILSEYNTFKLDSDTTISRFDCAHDFRHFVKDYFGFTVHRKENYETVITLSYSDHIKNSEGYELLCKNGSIHIKGKSDTGIFYGLETLKQLLIEGNGKLPDFIIIDEPLYSFRGFMLDSVSDFQSVEFIKKIINTLALHKINVLQWRLSGNAAFRFESKLYPELSAGFKHYSIKDLKEIRDYAKSRQIKIIPEIDMPTNCKAIISVHGELCCYKKSEAKSKHINRSSLCAGESLAYEFCVNILSELINTFKTDTIHIGGGGTYNGKEYLCEKCRQRMLYENLKNEDELHSYFINRVCRHFLNNNINVVMWDNFETGAPYMLDQRIIWQVTGIKKNKDYILHELAAGRRLIVSISNHYFLNLPYSVNSLKKAYEFMPEICNRNIDGICCALWTDYLKTDGSEEKLMHPRLGAISEIAWSDIFDRSYKRFAFGLDDYFDVLSFFEIGYTNEKRANPNKFSAFFENLRKPIKKKFKD